MKKFLLILVLMVLLVGSGWGNVMTMSSGSIALSQDFKFYNTTMTSSNEVGSVTLTAPTVSLDIQARGGDVYWVSNTANKDSVHWTIPNGTTWSPNITMPWDANTILYFYHLTTGLVTVEVLHNAR